MSWAGPNGNNNPFNRPGGPQGFWNFIHSLDPNMRTGAGVDHSAPWANLPAGFPFHGSEFGFGGGPGGWGAYGGWGEPRRGFGYRRGGGRCGHRGHHGSHGRHGMDEADEAMRDTEETMRDAAEESGDISEKEKDDSPDTIRDIPDEGPEHGHPHGPGRRGRGRHGRGPPEATPGATAEVIPTVPTPGGFDFANLQEWLNQFAGHPFAQQIREWATRFGGLNNPGAGDGTRGGPDYADDDSSFAPPVDIFATEKSYILHFALPGAKKDDIGVDWDAEKGELRVAGVVYRPGDEDFLATMASSERRIGMFSRSVPLPPPGSDREEIDALSITAKMEDGILIVTVPKLEKEWTEIHKVDIE
ncbi:heat shock protein 16 [Colletotrichum spaethianum]|uniref:Heat shock protein 16 n=1 Tax=Colletotrichum spaethianum TaxID=700344 RepID=A0AA37L5E9_9PEZI|nr:heat shock protein 16 [Colletotrichum spaethianum]GKT42061.1 heat shock protein 16 [Colletotrichum spaethianum]